MLKFFAFICLLGFSSIVFADWDEVTSNDDAKWYADSSTIIKKGSKAKMWSIKDYAEEQSQSDVSFSSVKSINEYDCKKRQIKQLYISEHDDSMGEGEIVLINYEPGKWQSLEKDSPEESLLKLVCDEKSETEPAE
jgi:hypothetical protein